MGTSSDSDREASLVIGPTSLGMVRILVHSEGLELPMDFDPDEALEIAEELRSSAERAAAIRGAGTGTQEPAAGTRRSATGPANQPANQPSGSPGGRPGGGRRRG